MIVLAFDTETTGLIDNLTVKIDKLPEVLEYYACLVDLSDGNILQEYDWLIKPKGNLNLEETKLKITEEMVADKPAFAYFAGDIKKMIENAPIVMAHNLTFDKEMIDTEFRRLGMELFWPRGICTVEQTVHLKSYRLSLSGLHEVLFGVPFEGAHRAKVDVTAMVKCAVELFKRGEL